MSNDSNNPLASSDPFIDQDIPPGVDRRTFLMRSAVVGATAVMLGRSVSAEERTQRSIATPPSVPALSDQLEVVKKGKGPVMTTLDEFYKVGPGPSSSHTIGPMRITYDFYQRATKLPEEPRHRVDLDARITALAQTAKEMNSKYKETSEAGLALSVVLC